MLLRAFLSHNGLCDCDSGLLKYNMAQVLNIELSIIGGSVPYLHYFWGRCVHKMVLTKQKNFSNRK